MFRFIVMFMCVGCALWGEDSFEQWARSVGKLDPDAWQQLVDEFREVGLEWSGSGFNTDQNNRHVKQMEISFSIDGCPTLEQARDLWVVCRRRMLEIYGKSDIANGAVEGGKFSLEHADFTLFFDQSENMPYSPKFIRRVFSEPHTALYSLDDEKGFQKFVLEESWEEAVEKAQETELQRAVAAIPKTWQEAFAGGGARKGMRCIAAGRLKASDPEEPSTLKRWGQAAAEACKRIYASATVRDPKEGYDIGGHRRYR